MELIFFPNSFGGQTRAEIDRVIIRNKNHPDYVHYSYSWDGFMYG